MDNILRAIFKYEINIVLNKKYNDRKDSFKRNKSKSLY